MKLARYGFQGSIHLGAVKDERIVPLDALGFGSMLDLIEAGDKGLMSVRHEADTAKSSIPLSEVELLAPIERPGKYLAIGMNYAKHLAEADALGVARSKHQVWFNKQTSCISGPFAPIEPGVTEKLDYEVELGAVIGRRAKSVNEENALSYVFGYFVAMRRWLALPGL